MTPTLSPFQGSNFKIRTKKDLANFARRAGVYRILNREGELLYVGKAKDLKARVQYYFKEHYDNPRIQQLVSQRSEIVITLTQSEAQALWLEQNYIQFGRPKYNVLLMDDRSYPWICLTREDYPYLRLHRGERVAKLGRYFGPFSSSRAAYTTLKLIKRLFHIRQCRGIKKGGEKRPCLDYHLGYCSGPCFRGMPVDAARYQQTIKEVEEFLNGKTQKVVERLAQQMRESSQDQDYEKALHYREQIRAVQQLTDRQGIQLMRSEDTDLLASASQGSCSCVYQLIVRNGGVVSGHAHFLKNSEELSEAELLWQFLGQFYLNTPQNIGLSSKETLEPRQWPSSLILPLTPQAIEPIEQALTLAQIKDLQVESVGRSSEKKRLFQLALLNAKQALQSELAFGERREDLFKALERLLGLAGVQAIDCIDISHLQGSEMVGAIVRLTPKGLSYSDYRKYPLKELKHSNDCAAIALTIEKRYRHAIKEQLPEVLAIDGGKAQFSAAHQTLQQLMRDNPDLSEIKVLALAKGKARRSGWEQIWTENGPISFERSVLWSLLEVRDAVHNYAVRGHRKERLANFLRNSLEKIPGIGPKKYQTLLEFTGGIGQLKGASLDQIKAIPGLSNLLAQRVWNALHASGEKGKEE